MAVIESYCPASGSEGQVAGSQAGPAGSNPTRLPRTRAARHCRVFNQRDDGTLRKAEGEGDYRILGTYKEMGPMFQLSI